MARNYRNESADIRVEEGTGPIVFMCNTEDTLEVFKRDCIVQLFTPECLDPDNTNPNMPYTKQLIYRDVGASDFVVSRVFIQAAKLMKDLGIEQNVSKDAIIDTLRDCRNSLVDSYIITCDLACEVMEVSTSYESNYALGKIMTIPCVDGLANKTKNFITNIKLTLQRFVDFFNIVFGTSFRGPRYDLIQSKINEMLGKDEYLSQILTYYHDNFLDYINQIRNAVEHPKDNYKLDIINFEMKPDGSILTPSWQLFPDRPRIEIVQEMTLILTNLVEFIELVVARSFLLKTTGPFGYTLNQIHEEAIDFNCSARWQSQVILPDHIPSPGPK